MSLHSMFPAAPIYTPIWNRATVPVFVGFDVRTTWMQKLPAVGRAPRLYAALYPLAFAGLDLHAYDIVISLTSSFAQGVRTNSSGLHVCYCHSPANFVWRPDAYFLNPTARKLAAPLRLWLKAWDSWASRQPDVYIATGQSVAERVKRFYHRDALIIAPPIERKWFINHKANDFYLVAARLVPHKRVELAIRACQRLAAPLVIVGSGRSEARLRKMARSDVRFAGYVSDDELRELYARARAVLVPSEEEFGLVALEAQAAGTPVIAFDRGGATETVVDTVTGIRFRPQTVDGLVDGIKRFEAMSWDHNAIQKHATRFDEARFRREFLALIDEYMPQQASLSVEAGRA